MVKKSAVTNIAIETRFAPSGLKCRAQSLREQPCPAVRPAGNAPRTSGMWISVNLRRKGSDQHRPSRRSLRRALPAPGCGTSACATTNIPTGNKNAAKAAELEEQVRQVRADRPNPVPRLARADAWRRNIEGGIVRRIGEQAQSEQNRQAQPHKADHFVETFVFGW